MRKYIEVARLQMKRNVAYRFQTWSRLLGDVMFIFMWYFVWKGLYNEQGTVAGVSFSQMVLYAIISQFLITMNNASSPIWRTDHLFRTGDIANELVKPYNFSIRILVECTANAVSYFFLSSLWVFSATFIILKIQLPTDIYVWLLFFVSAVLGFFVRFFIELSFSYLSFWIINIEGIRILFLFSVSLFSGSVVPLWFFPDELEKFVNLLPFKYIYYVPNLLIVNGNKYGEDAKLILMQFIWLIIMIALSQFIWIKGNKKVVVQGG